MSTLGWALLSPAKRDIRSASAGPPMAGTDVVFAHAPGLGAVSVVIAVALSIARCSFVTRTVVSRPSVASWSGFVGALGTVALLLSALLLPHEGWALALSSLALPAAVVVAILNGGLWDIDLVVSRSLVYGVLVAGVLGVYVVAVITLGDAARAHDRSTTGRGPRSSPSGSIPARVAHEGGEPLRLRLSGRPDCGAARALRPSRRHGGGGRHAARSRHAAAGAAAAVGRGALRSAEVTGRGAQFPLVYQGQVVGALLVQPSPGAPLSAADRRRSSTYPRQLAVVVHTHTLTDELMLSRERLVASPRGGAAAPPS